MFTRNFLYFSLHPWPLLCSLNTTEKSLPPLLFNLLPPVRCLCSLIRSLRAFSSPGWTFPAFIASSTLILFTVLCWSTVDLLSTRTARSFPAKLGCGLSPVHAGAWDYSCPGTDERSCFRTCWSNITGLQWLTTIQRSKILKFWFTEEEVILGEKLVLLQRN